MAERGYDQADGLRRMFSTDRLRVIHIVAGRPDVGRTSVAVNLGVALAKAGRDTLLVDCFDPGSSGRALAYLGLEPRTTAPGASVISGIVPGPKGLAVLPLTLGLARAGAPDRGGGAATEISTALLSYAASLDYVLMSSRSIGSMQLLPIEQGRSDVVVVLSRAASSITEAYALIKRLSATGAERRFQILVNRVGSDAEALLIYQNMAQVAQGYLDVQLDMLGFIPADAAFERAVGEGRSVIESTPKSPATRAFRRLADDIGGWTAPRPVRVRQGAACETSAGAV